MRWTLVAPFAAILLFGLGISFGQEIGKLPAPVDPVTQCQAFVELVIKDRAHAQTEAAYFAVRTQDLQAQVKALEAKVKELEAVKYDGTKTDGTIVK